MSQAIHLRSCFVLALGGMVLLAATLLSPAVGGAATLEKIRQSGVLTLGVREDAAPFSYRDLKGRPTGYSVSLCEAVARVLREGPGLENLKVEYLTVSAEERFDAIVDGRIDLLCGATTLTLNRREKVDFSLKTFVTGASVLYRAGGPASFSELNGQKVGVRAGTTTDDNLQRALSDGGINAQVVPIASHQAGRAALEAGDIAAYFADRAILVMLALQAEKPELLIVSKRFFSFEPYALALPLGDSAFRLAVDRALVRIYRGRGLANIYTTHFGRGRMSDLLRSMYTLQTLQE